MYAYQKGPNNLQLWRLKYLMHQKHALHDHIDVPIKFVRVN